jgi:tRNA pseudouridine32 synthase/23S rRNA pseudouridine746 synthase
VELNILHQDEHILVVDKPHFLPTTPGGTYIQESALVRLRNQLDLPDLIPMHRLDRMTAGILLLSTNPETRGKYQVLFEKRQVQKEYECVSAAEPGCRASRRRVPGGGPQPDDEVPQLPSRGGHRRRTERGDPHRPAADVRKRSRRNHEGRSRRRACTGSSRTPGKPTSSGCTWLRWDWASCNDAFYPELLDKAPDDYTKPLQLLARGILSWTPSRKSNPSSTAAAWSSAKSAIRLGGVAVLVFQGGQVPRAPTRC